MRSGADIYIYMQLCEAGSVPARGSDLLALLSDRTGSLQREHSQCKLGRGPVWVRIFHAHSTEPEPMIRQSHGDRSGAQVAAG